MGTPAVDNDYPLELVAPDIAAHRRGTGTGIDFAHRFEAARPGPAVLVSAVVHGNELCGAIVLDWLLREGFRPARGTLTLAFMNVAAYTSFDPADPTASRYVDEDFNRVWDETVLDGDRDSVELARAREVRPLLDASDYLLDIHSMQHSTVPLMMAGPLPKGAALSRALGVPRDIVADAGHAAGKRMRDYADFGRPESMRNALLVECGQHWASSSGELAREVTLRFLDHFKMLDADFLHTAAAGWQRRDSGQRQRVIEVTEPWTIKSDAFRFIEDYRGMEVIAEAGSIIAWDGDTPVRTPHPHCVLIMPNRRLWPGQSALRFGRLVGEG